MLEKDERDDIIEPLRLRSPDRSCSTLRASADRRGLCFIPEPRLDAACEEGRELLTSLDTPFDKLRSSCASIAFCSSSSSEHGTQMVGWLMNPSLRDVSRCASSISNAFWHSLQTMVSALRAARRDSPRLLLSRDDCLLAPEFRLVEEFFV
eukprot:760497-Prymnesium_polylepis.2